MNTVSDLWAAVMADLRRDMSEVAVSTWFGHVEAVEIDRSTLYLYCESGFCVMIIEQRYLEMVRKSLKKLFAEDIEVCFLTEEQYRKRQEVNLADERTINIEKRYTFDSFIVGESNRMAYSAAKAVAAGYDQYHNPLVIYGGSGLGKTHLLNAITNEVSQNDPAVKIALIKGDEFTNELISAIHTGAAAKLRDKYRSADLFLMDDVQFIAGKRQTQEEFFNTFEALYEAGSRIVITLDRPPKDLETLESRLLSRFEGGLIVEVTLPEYSLREALVRKKAEQRGLKLTTDEMRCIAESLTDSVRQIEGVLNQVKAYRSVPSGGNTDAQLVQVLTAKMANVLQIPDRPEQVIRELCAKLKVSEEQVLGGSQNRVITTARQMIIYVLSKEYGLSSMEIGRVMHRDHSTVLHAIQSIEKKESADAGVADTLKQLKLKSH